MEEFGVTREEVDRVLALISLPFSEAARQARKHRRKLLHTADKASILRQAPCLRFGKSGERVLAPLPELILERVTSGVFYDVVGGGGPVRNDYGRRFEEYCFNYLSEVLSGFEWEREFSYRKKPNTFDTPDILCTENDKITIAFECKATRMSHDAMFGKDPSLAKGLEDISKAVFQLWRFFSHSRRGLTGREVSEHSVGVVLTLDNWLVMAEPLREKVIQTAHELADAKDPQILEEDRKPVVFVAAPELESALTTATEATFKEALDKANSKDFLGWRLDAILRALQGGSETEQRKYPFSEDMGRLLPWWAEVRSRKTLGT